MISDLILFGATGDLAGRYLFPAIAELFAQKRLPAGFRILGVAPERWDLETFRRHVLERLQTHAAQTPAAAHEQVARSLSFRTIDVRDLVEVQRELADLPERGGPVAVYLALPAELFPVAVSALGGLRLPLGSRLVVEKPFGVDLQSAIALNQLLARVSGEAGEAAVFRVDHVLGMASVQNLIALRFANRVFQPVWNAAHLAQVEILWEETLGLEGRAGYFDHAGALKDVMQNHMFQLLTLVAMEPPENPSERAMRDRKVELLRSVRPLTAVELGARTRRARYTAGTLQGAEGAGRSVPAYAHEEGVNPSRNTETYAEVTLEIDNPRWAGTRFLLRAGKALPERRKEIVLRFRPLEGGDAEASPNVLHIGIDGPRDVVLQLAGGGAGSGSGLRMRMPPPPGEVPAYCAVLVDILSGGSALSVRGDEAEEAWRVLMPVVEGWRQGVVPLEEYPAGSAGPGADPTRADEAPAPPG